MEWAVVIFLRWAVFEDWDGPTADKIASAGYGICDSEPEII
jgi:hypothetical protein